MSTNALWDRLEGQVAAACDRFPGVAGACVHDIRAGRTLAVRGDEVFPTASTIKIHVLTQLLLRAERGELDLNAPIPLTPDLRVPGSGVLTYLEGDVTLSLLDMAILMIIASDNTATNICIDQAGIGATNDLLRSLGLKETTLRRKMQDYAAIARNDENVATPRECVDMLALLHAGRPSASVAAQALAILKKTKSGYFNRALPPPLVLANKPGGMERVRCDAGIVFLDRRPYILAVMTKFALCDPADQEGFVIDTARLIHQTMLVLESTSEYGQGIPRSGAA